MTLAALTDWATHLGMLAVFALAARGYGGFFAADELFRIGLGWAAIGYAMLGLGAVGGLVRPAAWVVLAVGIAANWLRGMGRPAARPEEPLGWRGWAGAAAMGVAAIMAALLAMTPPIGLDALAYHLAGPARFVAEGRIVAWPENPMVYTCGLHSMGYSAALLVLDDRLPAFLHLGIGALATAAVVGLARRWTSRGAAWLVGGLWAATPFVSYLGGMAYADLALAAYAVLAVLAYSEGRLGLSGLCAGLTVAVKPHGIVVAGLLGAAALVDLWRGRVVPRALAGYAAAILLCAAPFAARNWALTGSPVFPFAPALCRTPEIRLSAEEIVSFIHIHRPSLRRPVEALVAPWRAAVDDPHGMGMPFVAGTVLAAGLWALRGPRVPWLVLAIPLLGILAWQVGGPRPRYLLPLAALLCACAAPALRRAAPAGVTALVCAVQLWLAAGLLPDGAAAAAAGRLSPREYLIRQHREYEPILEANDRLPPDAKVLTVGMMRWYHLRRAAVIHTEVGSNLFWTAVREARTPREIAARLAGAGVTHVLMDAVWLDGYSQVNRVLFLTGAERARVAAFVERHTRTELTRGPIRLLRLEHAGTHRL